MSATDHDDDRWMRVALAEADAASDAGEVPVGCVPWLATTRIRYWLPGVSVAGMVHA